MMLTPRISSSVRLRGADQHLIDRSSIMKRAWDILTARDGVRTSNIELGFMCKAETDRLGAFQDREKNILSTCLSK